VSRIHCLPHGKPEFSRATESWTRLGNRFWPINDPHENLAFSQVRRAEAR
jgi:hypothetical protein